jgi:hypothetical protein
VGPWVENRSGQSRGSSFLYSSPGLGLREAPWFFTRTGALVFRVKVTLQASRQDYLARYSNRESLLEGWNEGMPAPDAHTLIELLQTYYEDEERFLTSAEDAAKGLFLITS